MHYQTGGYKIHFPKSKVCDTYCNTYQNLWQVSQYISKCTYKELDMSFEVKACDQEHCTQPTAAIGATTTTDVVVTNGRT